jgi:predicted ATP-dependent serine protease
VTPAPTWACLACGARYEGHRTFCGRCWAQGQIVDIGRRLAADVDAEPEALSALDLARMTWATVESSRYPELRMGRGCFLLVKGRRGSGKSSLVTGLLDGVKAPVLLLSVEEPPGPSLAARLLRVGVKRDDYGIASRASVDQVAAMLRQSKAAALAIDSVQRAAYSARDIRHLLAVIPTLALVVCVSQVNAEGEVRGGEEYGHECDVLIDVADMRWTIAKSRYQESGAGDVRLAPLTQETLAPEAA